MRFCYVIYRRERKLQLLCLSTWSLMSCPKRRFFQEGIRRAPDRVFPLNAAQTEVFKNASLRYPKPTKSWRWISGRTENARSDLWLSLRPKRPHLWKTNRWVQRKMHCCKAMQVMIDNNLSFEIALYPYELVTMGETGLCPGVIQLIAILEVMTDDQNLVVRVTLGLFKSKPEASPCRHYNGLLFWSVSMITCAITGKLLEEMVLPTTVRWRRWLDVSSVHKGSFTRTFNTLSMLVVSNGVPDDGRLTGALFISSGSGGMWAELKESSWNRKSGCHRCRSDRSRSKPVTSRWISQIVPKKLWNWLKQPLKPELALPW